MAERNPPSWLQGGSHTAENDRNLTAVLISSGGTLAAGDLAVTAPGGTMTVSVAAGQGFVKGSRAFQGVYHVFNDAAVTKTIAAADPTNARYDRVVAEVKDAAYSGSTNAFQINVYQGTPAASPVEPTIPADAFELARITVPAAATSINTGNILDRRVQATRNFAGAAQGLAANIGSPGQKMRLYYKVDSDYLTVDDGAAFHDFQSKAVADAAYVALGKAAQASRVTTNFAVLNTTNTVLTYPTVNYDPNSWFRGGADGFTVSLAGMYAVAGYASWADNSTGRRDLMIDVNGTVVHFDRKVAINTSDHSIARMFRLAAGDYVRLQAYQSSGGALNVTDCGLTIAKVG